MIDPDTPDTWPDDLRRLVKRNPRGSETEGPIRKWAETGGYLFRAYHCTRLLPHEVEMVRTNGLRVASNDLLRDRIQALRERGLVSENEARTLAYRDPKNSTARDGRVCLFLGGGPFGRDFSGVWPLLTTWGGEIVYMSQRSSELSKRLAGLSAPTVVVATIDLSTARTWVSPALERFMRAKLAGRREPDFCDCQLGGDVPPERVVDIWQPGNPNYDRFEHLPST